MSNNDEPKKKKFSIFEEDDDDEENITSNCKKHSLVNKTETNKNEQNNTTSDSDYQELLPTLKLETEENIAILFSVSKALIVINIIACIILFFIIVGNDNANGITFLIYIITAGILIFGAYISSTLIKSHALKLHQLYEINKKLDKITNEKKK